MASPPLFLPAGFQAFAGASGIHLIRSFVHLAVLAGITAHHFVFPLFVSPWLSVSVFSLCAFMLLLDGLRLFFVSQRGGGLSFWDGALFFLEALFFFGLAFVLGPSSSAALLISLAAFFEIAAFSLYGGWRAGAAFALALSLLTAAAFLLHGFEMEGPEPAEGSWKGLLALLNFSLIACVLFGALLSRAFKALQMEILRLRRDSGKAGAPIEPGMEMSLNLARKIKPALKSIIKSLPAAERRGPQESSGQGSVPPPADSCPAELKRLRDFIEGFIAFAEPLKAARPARSLDLEKLLKRALKRLRSHPDCPKNLESDLSCSGSGRVKGFPELLDKAFENILINSLQALKTRSRPKISVKIYKMGGRIVLEFWDNGHGIDGEDRKNLYSPLFSKRFGLGGLGLAAAKKIIHFHKGSIDAETAAAGTRVRAQLPLSPRDELGDEPGEEPGEEPLSMSA